MAFLSFDIRCVIAELFSEGTPIFSLSQMFKYRSGEFDPTPYINKIEDDHIKVQRVFHICTAHVTIICNDTNIFILMFF